MTATSNAADYLALEDLIVARLQAETAMPDRQVLTAPDIEEVEEQQQTTPAYHVIYAGDRAAGGARGVAANARAQVVEQLWLVVVAVKNVRKVRRGKAAREDAGPWVTEAIAALQGWKPASGYSHVQRDLSAPPAAYQAGYFYVPTLWAVTFSTVGTG